MPTINATVYPSEAYVLVEGQWPTILLQDSFSRTDPTSWQSPEIGATWTPNSLVDVTYRTDGSSGLVDLAAVNFRHTGAGTSAADVVIEGTVSPGVVATGAQIDMGFNLRRLDANNFYSIEVRFEVGATMSLRILRTVAGASTQMISTALVGTYAANTRMRVRFQVSGDKLLGMAWPEGGDPPFGWQIGIVDTNLVGAGLQGTNIRIQAGNTNVPFTALFDSIVAYDLSDVATDYAKVTRRNTVTGEIVTLRPYIAYDAEGNLLLECGQGLWWDTEPPLDVPLEYCLMSGPVAVNRAQNCCFETQSVVAPWTPLGGAANSTFLSIGNFLAPEGIRVMLIDPDGISSNPGTEQVISSGLTTDPITMSAWARSDEGWNAVRFQAVVTYTNGIVETVNSPAVALEENTWRFMSHTFTPQTTISSLTFRWQALGIPPNTTEFYIDLIQLTQQEAPTTSVCTTVTVPGNNNIWLKNPLNPCLDVLVGICDPMLDDCDEDSRVTYVGHESDDYAPNTVLLSPANRRRPIPVNRIRRDAVSMLRLLAHDCEARDAVLASNETGDPLLFQAPAQYCITDRYISVGTVNDSRISVDQREEFRLLSLPYAVVDRPEGPANGICGARIDDLCDIYSSWGALTIAGLTWEDLLLGEASDEGPGQPDPPAGQRTWADVEATFANWAAVEADGTWADIRDGT